MTLGLGQPMKYMLNHTWKYPIPFFQLGGWTKGRWVYPSGGDAIRLHSHFVALKTWAESYVPGRVFRNVVKCVPWLWYHYWCDFGAFVCNRACVAECAWHLICGLLLVCLWHLGPFKGIGCPMCNTHKHVKKACFRYTCEPNLKVHLLLCTAWGK